MAPSQFIYFDLPLIEARADAFAELLAESTRRGLDLITELCGFVRDVLTETSQVDADELGDADLLAVAYAGGCGNGCVDEYAQREAALCLTKGSLSNDLLRLLQRFRASISG